MTKNSLLKKAKQLYYGIPLENGIAYFTVIAVFIHYVASIAAIFFCFWFLILNKKTNRNIFTHKANYILCIFSVYTAIIGVIHKNTWYGVAMSALFFMIFVISFYLRTVFTVKLFENCLNLVCLLGFLTSIATIIERLIFTGDPNYRCALWFVNSNFLASILAAVIIICAYKEITKQGRPIVFYAISIFCAVGIYFCGSLFVWVEVLMGIAIFLSGAKKHQLLGIFLILCAVGCIILYCVPEIFPRISSESNITTDNRVLIWQYSITHIKDSPVFGQGYCAYHILPDRPYLTNHSHNIFLELLLDFGIIGTVILSAYFVFYYRIVVICKELLRHNFIPALILAVSAAVLMHSMVDMTMLWPNTMLLYSLVFAGIGATEKIVVSNRLKKTGTYNTEE